GSPASPAGSPGSHPGSASSHSCSAQSHASHAGSSGSHPRNPGSHPSPAGRDSALSPSEVAKHWLLVAKLQERDKRGHQSSVGGWSMPVAPSPPPSTMVFSFVVKAAAPTVYPLVPCDCDDEAKVSMACLAADFFPQPATISWTGASSGKQDTFPVLPVRGSYYALISQYTVSADQVDGGTFQCKVTHSSTGTTTKTIEDVCPVPPDVKLLSDPNKYENEVLLMCVVEGPNAGEATITWMVNHVEKPLTPAITTCDKCSGDKAIMTSQVNVSRQSWDNGAEFSCKVTHPGLDKAMVHNISTFCTDKPAVTITLLPPSLEDLYLNQNGSVTCVATNLKDPEDVKFVWQRDQGEVSDVTRGTPQQLENGLYRLTSTLKICAEEWNSGETFSCTVQTPQLEEPVTKTIKKELGRSLPPHTLPHIRPHRGGEGGDGVGLGGVVVASEKLGEKGKGWGRRRGGVGDKWKVLEWSTGRVYWKEGSTGRFYWEGLLEGRVYWESLLEEVG
uniref:Ig-like domain-containing protein n=1 Tax=Calidris pygmaea TaxID=425635 RepID=A0A8C3PIL1_9CHAR